jgi:hypothetical protein
LGIWENRLQRCFREKSKDWMGMRDSNLARHITHINCGVRLFPSYPIPSCDFLIESPPTTSVGRTMVTGEEKRNIKEWMHGREEKKKFCSVTLYPAI